MRRVEERDTADGKRFKVRYRLDGRETSETFRRKADAQSFAAALAGGGPDGALAWLEAREQQHHSRVITFGDWFDTYVDQLTGVSPRTRSDYHSLRRRYLADLDPLPLNLITRGHVTSIVNAMDAAGRAPKTIKQAIHLLSTCLTLAIDEGHITANPCKRVRLPSQSLDTVGARFLTEVEFSALVDATPAHWRPLVVFLVGSGLRWSEATALQTRHVNLDAGTVRVEQAWKRVPGTGFVLGPPKTRKARRTVNPAAIALAAVAPLLGRPNAFVFTTAAGAVVRHANFYSHVWRPACAAAGLDPAPRIHDARHTHASWLISDGQQLEAVQDQLGHESILTTRNVYGHLLPALGVAVGRSASQSLARALRQQVESGVLALPAGVPGPGRDPDELERPVTVGPEVHDGRDAG